VVNTKERDRATERLDDGITEQDGPGDNSGLPGQSSEPAWRCSPRPKTHPRARRARWPHSTSRGSSPSDWSPRTAAAPIGYQAHDNQTDRGEPFRIDHEAPAIERSTSTPESRTGMIGSGRSLEPQAANSAFRNFSRPAIGPRAEPTPRIFSRSSRLPDAGSFPKNTSMRSPVGPD
jgi:hypothetical protein